MYEYCRPCGHASQLHHSVIKFGALTALRVCTLLLWCTQRGALPAGLCAAARDLLWSENTSKVLKRGDPSTYCGPLPEEDFEREKASGNNRSEYRWQVRVAVGETVILLTFPLHPC